MRIDDLGFFLQVECLLVVFDISLRKFTVIVLTVVREQSLGIRVTHKAVHASRLSRALVASRQRLERSVLPDGLRGSGRLRTILAVILTEATILLTLGRCIEFFSRLAPTVLARRHLRRSLNMGSHSVLMLTIALAGLCTRWLLAHSGLVHRLEWVVARKTRVVEVLVASGALYSSTLLRYSAIVVTSLRHID